MEDPRSALAFDPSAGTVVREPEGTGYGFWVGGKVSYDSDSATFALFYRQRHPLEHGRAGRCVIAESSDGIVFEDRWEASRDDLNANSIEEGHVVRSDNGWRAYVSYEVAGSATWRIDVLEAPALDAFDAQGRRTVLHPGDYGLAWIKDPFVVRREGMWWVYAATNPRTGPVVNGDEITAGPLDATVLAVSHDGLVFPSVRYVFEAPGDGTWHGNRARINSVFPSSSGYVATFDGGRTFYDNYEEWAGLAVSADGIAFTRIVGDEPWAVSPHGCVRYVCAVPCGNAIFLYYEYTRADGSHDLRVAVVS